MSPELNCKAEGQGFLYMVGDWAIMVIFTGERVHWE